jgi:hypothetical protein
LTFSLSSQKLESIFNGLASYLDLGDGNQLGLVVQVVSAASQRYDFVLRLMASAYGMLNASTKSTWAFEVVFLCTFCK